jgi:ribosomal protein L32
MPLEGSSQSLADVVFGVCPDCGKPFMAGDVVNPQCDGQLVHEDCSVALASSIYVTDPDWQKSRVKGALDFCQECGKVVEAHNIVSIELSEGMVVRVCTDCADDYEDQN